MKKLLLFCAIALLALVSCDKEAMIEQIEAQSAPAAKVTLNLKVQSASAGGETKAVKTTWAEDDKLYLVFAQDGAITKEGAKKVILTYNAEGEWEVAEGQDALNEIDGDGLVSGVYLAGGEFEWREGADSWSVTPATGTTITEAQKSDASAYTFSESTITATITLQQAGSQISISNISGNDWTITADDAEYQEIYAINGIDFSFGASIESSANTSGALIGREEDGKVVFYGIPTGATRSVKLTVANASTSYSYTKTFPEERTLQVGKAVNVQGPQLNGDGSLSVANDWFWNENPVFRTITYTTSDGNKLPLPATAEEQITMFGASVASHEYNECGEIIFSGIVTKIGDNAFNHAASNLQTMTIPEHVTAIGANAFNWCLELSSINLPEGLQSIGENAFYYCRVLDGVSIPSTVSFIGDCAFSGCLSLSDTLTVPDGITVIGNGVFESCIKITEINLPEGLLSIGESAFEFCGQLNGVSIPSTVSFIGDWAFSGCSSLSDTLTVPNGITAIGNNVFAGCSGITGINLPEGLQSIGACAFAGCSSLRSISIPSSVTAIGMEAFSQMDLDEITFLPATPPNFLGEYAFNMSSVGTIYVPGYSIDAYWKVLGSLAEKVQGF